MADVGQVLHPGGPGKVHVILLYKNTVVHVQNNTSYTHPSVEQFPNVWNPPNAVADYEH